jgi:hypothetical protein
LSNLKLQYAKNSNMLNIQGAVLKKGFEIKFKADFTIFELNMENIIGTVNIDTNPNYFRAKGEFMEIYTVFGMKFSNTTFVLEKIDRKISFSLHSQINLFGQQVSSTINYTNKTHYYVAAQVTNLNLKSVIESTAQLLGVTNLNIELPFNMVIHVLDFSYGSIKMKLGDKEISKGISVDFNSTFNALDDKIKVENSICSIKFEDASNFKGNCSIKKAIKIFDFMMKDTTLYIEKKPLELNYRFKSTISLFSYSVSSTVGYQSNANYYLTASVPQAITLSEILKTSGSYLSQGEITYSLPFDITVTNLDFYYASNDLTSYEGRSLKKGIDIDLTTKITIFEKKFPVISCKMHAASSDIDVTCGIIDSISFNTNFSTLTITNPTLSIRKRSTEKSFWMNTQLTVFKRNFNLDIYYQTNSNYYFSAKSENTDLSLQELLSEVSIKTLVDIKISKFEFLYSTFAIDQKKIGNFMVKPGLQVELSSTISVASLSLASTCSLYQHNKEYDISCRIQDFPSLEFKVNTIPVLTLAMNNTAFSLSSKTQSGNSFQLNSTVTFKIWEFPQITVDASLKYQNSIWGFKGIFQNTFNFDVLGITISISDLKVYYLMSKEMFIPDVPKDVDGFYLKGKFRLDSIDIIKGLIKSTNIPTVDLMVNYNLNNEITCGASMNINLALDINSKRYFETHTLQLLVSKDRFELEAKFSVLIDTSHKNFTGKIGVAPGSLILGASLETPWDSPFGLNFLKINSFSLEVGFTAGTLTSSSGSGNIVLKNLDNLEIRFAYRVDSADPTKAYVSFSMSTLSGKALVKMITGNDHDIDFSIEGVQFFYATSDLVLDSVSHKQGGEAKGKLYVKGQLICDFSGSFDNFGISAKVILGKITIGEIFKMERGSVEISTKVISETGPYVKFAGYFNVLGNEIHSTLTLSQTRFAFSASISIRDVGSYSISFENNKFQVTIDVTGNELLTKILNVKSIHFEIGDIANVAATASMTIKDNNEGSFGIENVPIINPVGAIANHFGKALDDLKNLIKNGFNVDKFCSDDCSNRASVSGKVVGFNDHCPSNFYKLPIWIHEFNVRKCCCSNEIRTKCCVTNVDSWTEAQIPENQLCLVQCSYGKTKCCWVGLEKKQIPETKYCLFGC